jgi:hypothetical protein
VQGVTETPRHNPSWRGVFALFSKLLPQKGCHTSSIKRECKRYFSFSIRNHLVPVKRQRSRGCFRKQWSGAKLEKKQEMFEAYVILLGCIKPLRNALQQFAFHSTRSERWAKQYSQRAEGKSHTVAVRAPANVWVRILFAVWSRKASTFEAAQHAHA